eukprot:SAG31_NODE_21981_length_536_cov_1.137300_1_plen_100_part_10
MWGPYGRGLLAGPRATPSTPRSMAKRMSARSSRRGVVDDRLVPTKSFVAPAATEWHQTVLEHKETLCNSDAAPGSSADVDRAETYVDEYADMTEDGGGSS